MRIIPTCIIDTGIKVKSIAGCKVLPSESAFVATLETFLYAIQGLRVGPLPSIA